MRARLAGFHPTAGLAPDGSSIAYAGGTGPGRQPESGIYVEARRIGCRTDCELAEPPILAAALASEADLSLPAGSVSRHVGEE